MEHVLEAEQVTKRFGDFVAVSQISFQIPRGSVYGFLGPNGAGKTTMLRMVNDILRPDEGGITLFEGLAPGRQASRNIGYLPEERGLFPKMRVGEVLRFFAELRGIRGRESKKRVDRWLEELGIGDWRGKRVQELSKGMQQKVQFATALLHEPELLILDEPWSGLDPINAEVLRDIVVRQRDSGRTVLFSTHLMEQAEKICDHVCIIARGKVAIDGELAEVKRQTANDCLFDLEFATRDYDSARAFLAGSSLVDEVVERSEGFRIRTRESGASNVVLQSAVAAGLSIRSFALFEPTLHEIFVAHVGDQAGAAIEGRVEHA